MSFVDKLFNKVPTRPNVGAVARLPTIRENSKHFKWVRRLLGNGSWLMLFGALLITWLPLSQQVEMDRSAISYTLTAYFLYILLLEVTSRKHKESYESYWFQCIRISVNLIVISLLVLFSSGQHSYFWFFFTLPIFQAVIYSDFQHVMLSVLVAIGMYFAATYYFVLIENIQIDWASFLMQSIILALLGLTLFWLFGSAQTIYQLDEHELEALRSITRDLANNYDRHELLQTIIRWAVKLLHGDGGGIYEYHESSKTLVVIADFGEKDSILGQTLKLGQGMAGRVIESSQSLIVNNYHTWSGRASIYAKELFHAVVAVPLVWQGSSLGVLYVTDNSIKRKFQKRDAYILELLANQAAIAMLEETRRRAKALERKTEQLRTLNDIGQLISAAPTLDDMLQAALGQGLTLVGTNEGSIMLVNQKTKELEIKAGLVQGNTITGKIHRRFKQDEGIVGHVYKTGKAYLSGDVLSDTYFAESFTGRTIRSLLCVPILVHSRPIGIINADSEHENFFNTSDLQFLSALAGHLATALERFQLREIGTELSTINLEALLERVVESVSLLTGAEYSTLFLLDDTTQKLKRVRNFPPNRTTSEPPRSTGLSYEILQSGQPIAINDIQNNPRVKERSKLDRLTSIMGVPLKLETHRYGQIETKVIGVLWANTRQREPFGMRDIKLLESLASQAAVAIENARLVEALRERTTALEELYETSLDLTQYKTTPELVCSILDRSVKLLGADGGGLYLLDRSNNTLKLAAISNMPSKFKGSTFEVGQSVVGRVVQTKRPFRVSDYRNWPHRLHGYDALNFTAVIGAPIMWQDQIWGVITVRDVQEGREFTKEEEDLLITLGNHAAIALENSRQRETLERLMESAIHAIIAINEDGNIFRCNEPAERLLGYTAAELITIPVENLYFVPEDAQKIKHRLIATRDGRLTDYDTAVCSKSGERIPIRLSASLLYDYEGNRAGSVGFFRDLREMESARRQVERLTSLLQAGQAIIELQDLSLVLNKIANKTMEVLEADLISLYLYDHTTKQIVIPPVRRGLRHEQQASLDLEHNSIVQKAIDNDVIAFIENAKEHPLVSGDFVNREAIQSSAVCTLKIQNQIKGVLFCNYRERHFFSEEEKTSFRLFASMAALAIENARLFEETHQRATVLRELYQTALEITRYQSTPKLVDSILQRAVDLLGGTGGALYLLDDTEKSATIATVCNLPADLRGEVLAIGNNLVGKVIKDRKPLLIEDYRNWPSRLLLYEDFQFDSVAGAPIGWQDKIWGVIVVHSNNQSLRLDQDGLTVLSNLGSLAAIALENARRTEKLQSLMNSSFDAIIAADVHGHITEFNEKAEEILGYSATELLGFPIAPLYYQEGKAQEIMQLLTENGDGRLPDYETQVVTKHGDTIPIRLSASLLRNFEGNLVGSVGFFRDLRAIRELEGQIQAMNTVNLVFMLLSRWLHEAKQKVFAVQKNIETLRSELPANLYEDILTGMNESLSKLQIPSKTLFEDAEKGFQRTGTPINLHGLFVQKIDKLTERRSPDIQYEIKAPNDGYFWVVGSEFLLETAVDLLLENAIESIQLKEKPREIIVHFQQQNDNICVTVADTGIGIPPEIQKDLFHLRVHSNSGFGYGSLTVAHILRAYKGDIYIQQTSPEGTEITFFLPRAKEFQIVEVF
jgi:PAS domain S-box-containing protein